MISKGEECTSQDRRERERERERERDRVIANLSDLRQVNWNIKTKQMMVSGVIITNLS